MAYTTFEHFVEKTNNRLVNENVDKIVGTIVESKIPFDVFYTECLLPVLLESNSSDPLELISEVGNWLQRNMTRIGDFFRGGPKEAPVDQNLIKQQGDLEDQKNRIQKFRQDNKDVFDRAKLMLVQSLKKIKDDMLKDVAFDPRAKMLVPALDQLVNVTANAIKNHQFEPAGPGAPKTNMFSNFLQNHLTNMIKNDPYFIKMKDNILSFNNPELEKQTFINLKNYILKTPEYRDNLNKIKNQFKTPEELDSFIKYSLAAALKPFYDKKVNKQVVNNNPTNTANKTNLTANTTVRSGSQPAPAPFDTFQASTTNLKPESTNHGHDVLVESLIRCVGRHR